MNPNKIPAPAWTPHSRREASGSDEGDLTLIHQHPGTTSREHAHARRLGASVCKPAEKPAGRQTLRNGSPRPQVKRAGWRTVRLLIPAVFLAMQLSGLGPGGELRAMCIPRHHSFNEWGVPLKAVQQPAWRALAGYPWVSGTNDGTGWTARFAYPSGIASGGPNGVYVLDSSDSTIRKINSDGTVSTLAGKLGVWGYDDGPVTIALFAYPTALVADTNGNVYVADLNRVRKIASDGIVSTLAGNTNFWDYQDGTGTNAHFGGTLSGLALDKSGNLYVADAGNLVIRKITPAGVVSTLAGSPGQGGYQDGTGTNAFFDDPAGIATDANGFLYVSEARENVIRKISPDGQVSTLAGQPGFAGYQNGPVANATFKNPGGLALDAAGNVYVADTGNACIRKITPDGQVSTVAGTLNASQSWGADYADGLAPQVIFSSPAVLAMDDQGHLLVADIDNNMIYYGGIVGETHPQILVQPADQSIQTGSNAVMQVVAQGTAALSYQWFVGDGYFPDDRPIPGATNASLTLSKVQMTDAATYRVAISDGFGYRISRAASLQVVPQVVPPASATSGLFANWHPLATLARNPISPIAGVAYGNNHYVAVGNSGIMDSPDGLNWTPQAPPPPQALTGIAFGNGRFVAVGNSGTVLTSTDGLSWDSQSLSVEISPSLQSVIYDQGLFVAVSSDANGSLWSSSDGITWTNQGFDFDISLMAVTSGNGRFVAVGNTILTSTNGVDWEPIPAPSVLIGDPVPLGYVAYGNGIFLASEEDQGNLIEVGDFGYHCSTSQGRLFLSLTGVDWQEVTPTNGLFLNRVIFGNGRFAAVDFNSGGICFSTDGINWSAPVTVSNSDWTLSEPSLCFVQNTFIAVGDTGYSGYGGEVFTSTNAVSWEFRDQDKSIPFLPSALINVDGQYIGCYGNIFMNSTNGQDWNMMFSTNAAVYSSLAFGTGVVVAVGAVGGSGGHDAIATSTDGGTHWAERTLFFAFGYTDPRNSNLSQVTFGKDGFVAVGTRWDGNEYRLHVVTSSDGFNWQLANNVNTIEYEPAVSYGNGIYVITGLTPGVADTVILSSTNGSDWNQTGHFGGCSPSSMAFGNQQFVVSINDTSGVAGVLTSPDGRTWTRHSNVSPSGLYQVVFESGFFLSENGSGNVYSSSDGITWTTNLTSLSYIESLAVGEGVFLAYGADASGQGLFQSDPIERLGQPVRQPNGKLQWTVTGARHLNYEVEASEDLLTWQSLTNVTDSIPVQPFTDPDANGHQRRFYRVVTP